MNKIFIIIRREYLTRVKNKTFLLTTFLLPIVFLLFIVGSTFLAVKSKTVDTIAVITEANLFKQALKSDSTIVIFDFTHSVTTDNYLYKGYSGILRIPSDSSHQKFVIESPKTLSMETMDYIKWQINNVIENNMLKQLRIDENVLDSISTASENAFQLTNELTTGEEANAGLAYGVGFGSGILIYLTMFIFGAMVMRGVMEEKTNRIAEVMVSSVKPFQLMMGKIIGIAAVGLTQLVLWILFIILLLSAVQLFIPSDVVEQFKQIQEMQQQLPGGSSNTVAFELLQAKATFISEVNWSLIISCFLFYFLGGYLFYASLFAAVGSVINEDPQEAQSLMLPITLPIIFAFIMLAPSIENPDSSLAFWGSMIPFTSPIIMMGRIANGVPEAVPYWQLFLSMILLIGGFILTTWFAGKIYRTGILLYGKKASWKEMIKWIRRS
ncbi:MAG: ABC transporter permease [Chitinophagaceae bacterium]|nr:MAG: ABC transporter permease [Chitinophagaceae bacterium]